WIARSVYPRAKTSQSRRNFRLATAWTRRPVRVMIRPHDPHRAPLHRRPGAGAALWPRGRALPRQPADLVDRGEEARGRTWRAVRARQAEDPADAAGRENRGDGGARARAGGGHQGRG